MGSTKLIRAAKTGYLILAALFCAMGIAMLTSPDSSARMLGWGTGTALAAFGIVRIIGFFSKDIYCLAFQHDPALGALAIALGLVLMFRHGLAVNTLCLVLGVEMVTDNLLKIQTAVEARRFGLQTWWLMFALAVATAAVGALLIACPFQQTRTMVQVAGVTLLSQGVLSFCVALSAIKITPRRRLDAVA